MSLISLAEIIPDPDFAQSFIINRTADGDWNDDGIFIGDTQQIYVTGIITPMKTRDMVQLAAGDQLEGFINVYTITPLYTTALKGSSGGRLSDEIVWREDNYKVLSVENFIDFGYYHAVAVYKRGA